MSWEKISDTILQSAQTTSVAEWIGTITAVIYVVLAARENIFCWHFGAVSSALSVAVYFHEGLYFETLLSVAYCIISVYGWWQWRTKGQGTRGKGQEELKISRLDFKTGMILLFLGIFLSALFGGISFYFKTSQLPFADASITVFSVLATWMTAKKILENWMAWIIIDAAAACVYIYKGPSLYLFALLFIFYTFIALAGHFSWKKKLQSFNA
jgi:nicotinamide mononucleotide transporter